MKKIKLENFNCVEFKDFIDKMMSFSSSVFFRITPEGVISSVYNNTRDIVKISSIERKELFDSTFDEEIKMGFYEGKRLLNILKHFGSMATAFIEYDVYEDENVATRFAIADTELRVSTECLDPSIDYIEMSKSDIERCSSEDDKVYQTEFLATYVKKVSSLFNIDDDDYFNIRVDSKGVFAKGKNFSTILTNSVTMENPFEVTLTKDSFKAIDSDENHTMVVSENKVIFKSLDTNTTLILSTVIKESDE